MLLNAKRLNGFTIQCLDGEIGTVSDILFDDLRWKIRYLVIDTGSWLTGRQVLISPHAIIAIDDVSRHVLVRLTKQQIEESPPLDSDRPVSLQFEELYHGYYQWPTYWSEPFMWEPIPTFEDIKQFQDAANKRKAHDDHHLRSIHQVIGYTLTAADGDVGDVSDFIINDLTWALEYLVVATGHWWSGKQVLLAPRWAQRISWDESKVFVTLTCAVIKESPEFIAESPITRDYEMKLHDHYQRQGYWDDEPMDRPAFHQ